MRRRTACCAGGLALQLVCAKEGRHETWNHFVVSSESAGRTDGGKGNRIVSPVHEDRPHEVVLPDERKETFSKKDTQGMKDTAALRAADRNPYSRNMEFLPYADRNGYDASFSKCGICTLMRELGLFDLVPAMCRLDHTTSEAGGVSDFVRASTPASGGPYCDCGYKKKRG